VRPRALLLLALMAAPPALADTHSVTVTNTGVETIRSIAVGAGGENRLRSQVPPGAQARVTYSTGCTADVRIGYDSGRMETFAGVDICSDPRIATGQGVLGGAAAPGAAQVAAAPRPAPGKAASVATAKPPLPAVPPWTGKSITKRFGGMD
jgi:hypothetical protein